MGDETTWKKCFDYEFQDNIGLPFIYMISISKSNIKSFGEL